ncbi:hypothetical protein [Edaphobacter aggregans]|uniref:hypothetical protein n=1 Tax=Edaphobacter aggregans TaxID=570835 RepID=UPI00055403C4|nr:hypothetical protein [Edaphobacter aggregans]
MLDSSLPKIEQLRVFLRRDSLDLQPVYLRCTDLMQFIRSRFTDEHGNLIICRLPSMLRRELTDRFIPLLAAL